MNVTVEIVPQQHPLLGRQMVHDERSRAFALPAGVDRSRWHDKAIRVYDPLPNPNQIVGCCTGVAKAVQFNAAGNRKRGTVLDMEMAESIYSKATTLDPWDGAWPPTDTGSSGLASAKAAQQMGLGGEYRWVFNGADGVITQVMAGHVVSVGTWWYDGMMPTGLDRFNALPIVKPTGARVGGHQYAIRGYDADRDRVLGRCWWGTFRDFWMARADLDTLLAEGGDAHVQDRII